MKQIIALVAIAGLGIASCTTSADKQKQAALEAQQKTIDSLKIEMAKQHSIDSMSEVACMQIVVPQMLTPVAEQPKAVA